MDFFRRFSKKHQVGDKTGTSVGNHFYISQLEAPPTAYAYRNFSFSGSSIDREPLLRESKTQSTTEIPLENVLKSPERPPVNPQEFVGELSYFQQCETSGQVTNLTRENDRLRMENAELKVNLEKESVKYMVALSHWIEAEKELGELLRVSQTRHVRWRRRVSDEEDNNNEGTSEEETE